MYCHSAAIYSHIVTVPRYIATLPQCRKGINLCGFPRTRVHYLYIIYRKTISTVPDKRFCC